MRRHVLANPWIFAGSLGILFIGVILMGVTLPVVDAWFDQWRDFAARLEGCVDAASCSTDRFDMWMIAPWGAAVGTIVATISLAAPYIRRRTDT